MIVIRADILTQNGERITEPIESRDGLFPGEWWPAALGAEVSVHVDVRPEVRALYPDLPTVLRVQLRAVDL
jgi:hypothetical protein